jgi:AcrR family transcriptional regulator
MRTTEKRKPGRPSGAVSDETRLRITEAACKCFAERGYGKTSNQDIARLAGVTTGALYHYFTSKAELFAAVHRHVQGVLFEFYRRAFAEHTTCVEQLCAGMEASVTGKPEQPEVARFASIASVEIQRHRELSDILAADIVGIRHFFTRLIEAGRARGEIAPDLATQAVVDMIIASFFGLAWLRAQVGSAEEHAAAVRAFERLLRGTVFPKVETGDRLPSRHSDAMVGV